MRVTPNCRSRPVARLATPRSACRASPSIRRAASSRWFSSRPSLPPLLHRASCITESCKGRNKMGIALKLSTGSQEIPLGHFVDDTDGKTAETALTINNTDIRLWKNGATTLANKNSGGATHISGGIYYAALDATD